MKSTFALIAIFCLMSHEASASGDSIRPFGVFFGGALTRSFATIEQASVNAKLDGWGNFGEVGIDLPLSESFGFAPSIEIGESQLVNKYHSETYLDQTRIQSKGIRALIYLGGFEAGGSYRKLDVDLKTVSTSSGASNANFGGSGQSFFVGYSFTYKNGLRTTIEAESTQFQSENFKFQDVSVGLRIHLLLGGLLGRH